MLIYIQTLEEIWNALSWHVTYIPPDDEWLTGLLRYFVIIYYLKLHQTSPSSDTVNMLKNAVVKETEFELLLRYIEEEQISLSIKNIDENLRNDRCKW